MKMWFVLGTAAELIKIYPVIQSAEQRGLPWMAVSTGQAPVSLFKQIEDFDLTREKFLTPVPNQKDLSSKIQAGLWFLRARRLDPRSWSKSEPGRVIVHGDTLSTWIGAHWAKKLGVDIVHVEAGLRSNKLFSPFPEEWIRRKVSRRARWHMAPGPIAAQNLAEQGIEAGIIDTGANTLADTVKMFGPDCPKQGPYALVNIHRFENLNQHARWKIIQRTIEHAARRSPLTWVLHPTTRAKLAEHAAWAKKIEAMGVTLIDRLPFSIFIKLLAESAYVITDGGSNQEECYYLGKPCLVLRSESERPEGLGQNASLSCLNEEAIADFLNDPQKFARAPQFPKHSPSQIILDTLLANAPAP